MIFLAEQVFCSGKVLYAGQAIGLVVAETHALAIQAAKLVQIKYKDTLPPVLTIKDALQSPERVRPHNVFGPPNVFDVGNTAGVPHFNKRSKFKN